MTETKARYEDKWEFLDEDQVIEVSKLPVFLAFIESESLKEFNIAYTDGREITLIAKGPDNTRVIHESSIAKFDVDDKERVLEVLGNTENDLAAAQRYVMRTIMESFFSMSNKTSK